MDFSTFGWRDGVLLLAVVVAVYLLVSVLRLVALRRRRPVEPPHQTAIPDAPADEPQWPTHWPEPAPAEPPAEAVAAKPDFRGHLADSRLEMEVRQLREEVAQLRRELSELKAARRVSPQYADAMTLARRGYDAQGIAAECGISVAEAELVLSLSRDRVHFDDEVDHDGRAQDAAGPAGQ